VTRDALTFLRSQSILLNVAATLLKIEKVAYRVGATDPPDGVVFGDHS
jgi:hypothetical protein